MKAHPERLFLMRLARELGMSKRRLLQEMDSREISEWIAYFALQAKLEKKEQSADALKAKFQALAPVKKDGGNKRKG